MKKEKHTVGPWKRLPISGSCSCRPIDVQLMMASPDLLNACKMVRRYLSSTSIGWDVVRSTLDEAISKAEGTL